MASQGITLVLVAALVACGQAFYFQDPTATGAFPLDTATLQQVASSDLDAHLVGAAAVGSGGNCTVTCNGESYGGLEGNKTKGVDCWGTFKAFCKGSSEKACGVAGYKCEGHFVGFKAPCGAKIGVCAGEAKKFAKAFVKTCKGPIKIFKAGGGIGVSGAAIAAPNMTLPPRVEWPASLAAAEGLKGLYEGQLPRHPVSLEGGPYTLKKAFGDGLGGGLVAVKKLTAEDEAKWDAKHAEGHGTHKMTFEKLEEKAEKKLHKLGVALPVRPSYAALDLAPLVGSGGCEVTCNGKPAWFKGKFPCWGYLKVECAVSPDDEEKVGSTALATAPTESVAGDENLTIFSKAGCKGFWSGIFGKKCSGFSYSKVAVKDIKKYAYCSGKKGIFAKKRGTAFVAGGSCFGKGLFALQYTPESYTEAA